MTPPGGATSAPRVFGLMVVRDAIDLIRVNVLHHLSAGVERLLICDNGSTDGTREQLERLARRAPVDLRVDAGPFDQQRLTNELAAEARRQGADWALPIDVDEFFVGSRPLPLLFPGPAAGAVRIEVVNFVQRRRQERTSERALLTMDHRPARTIPQGEARYHVSVGEWSLVEVAWHPKLAFRPGESTRVLAGAHEVLDPLGPIVDSDIVCLHAPLRARSRLEARIAHGRRLAASGAPEEVGWQSRDIAGGARELASLWRANSNRGGWLDVGGERRALVRDRRLRDAIAPHVHGPLTAAVARARGR
jgi:hypothetical protein